MTPPPSAARMLSRLLCGDTNCGELNGMAPPFRSMVELLNRIEVPEDLTGQARREALAVARRPCWDAMVAATLDHEQLILAVANSSDSDEDQHEPETAERCATLADIQRLGAEDQWLWKGWLPRGVLIGVAADPGTGKTILAADIGRRLWFGLPWPDGQANELPERTRTLWVPGDRHYMQLSVLAKGFGLPAEAILLNAPATDPTAGLDLDDPAELDALRERIKIERPGLVIVDTVGQTTAKNLCKPEDARDYFGPLMDMALQTGVPILPLTHLSKDGQALGRRISGVCRVVWKLAHPDPDGQPNRRRVSVDKSYSEKPPALGMTIAGPGCEFDFNPPSEPKPGTTGRPAKSSSKAREFIIKELTERNDRPASILCGEWEKTGESASAFCRARDVLRDAGEVTCEGKPLILHLNQIDDESDPEE